MRFFQYIHRKGYHFYFYAAIGIFAGIIIAFFGKIISNSLPAIVTGAAIATISLVGMYLYWVYQEIKIVNHSTNKVRLLFNYYKNLNWEKDQSNFNKIKLIICDLDGTLLDHNGNLSSQTLKKLKILQTQRPDLMIVPATGRGHLTSYALLKGYLQSKYMICHNGSVLSEFDAFRPLAENSIALEFVQPLFDFTLANDIHALVFSDKGENLIHNTCLAANTWFESWIQQYQISQEPLTNHNNFYQCGIWVPIKKVAMFEKFIQENICVEMYFYKHREFTYYEITGAGVNKQSMIEEICRREAIHSSEVMAIGNGNNDIKMISKNSIGVAVGNAEKPLLQVADIIIDPNYEDGVINFLTDVFLR